MRNLNTRHKTYFILEPNAKYLTGMVFVKQEGTLELEVKVLSNRLNQVVQAEVVYDGEPVLGIGLPLVQEQGALHPRFLQNFAELVERHLAAVSLDGHDVGVNLKQQCAGKLGSFWLKLTFRRQDSIKHAQFI